MKGTIKFFINKKGYGFITADDGKDYFLHISQIEGFNGIYPVEGQAVEFAETRKSDKGLEAVGAVLIGKEGVK